MTGRPRLLQLVDRERWFEEGGGDATQAGNNTTPRAFSVRLQQAAVAVAPGRACRGRPSSGQRRQNKRTQLLSRKRCRLAKQAGAHSRATCLTAWAATRPPPAPTPGAAGLLKTTLQDPCVQEKHTESCWGSRMHDTPGETRSAGKQGSIVPRPGRSSATRSCDELVYAEHGAECSPVAATRPHQHWCNVRAPQQERREAARQRGTKGRALLAHAHTHVQEHVRRRGRPLLAFRVAAAGPGMGGLHVPAPMPPLSI